MTTRRARGSANSVGNRSSGVPAAQELRKTVTVLFCDLTGSTSLGETIDPRAARALLARYFEQMKAIVERHGGTVEKFIGDAVMAVFGVPTVHEDDALRAVRSAAEMRDALPGSASRADRRQDGRGGDGDGERLVTGDAVNVAARLRSRAARRGADRELTLALVRDAVEVERVEPLELKGKAETVLAYRLLRVRDSPERRHDARSSAVGASSLSSGRRGAGRAERCCELVTIVGDAGVGKSRLVAEALARSRRRSSAAAAFPTGTGSATGRSSRC